MATRSRGTAFAYEQVVPLNSDLDRRGSAELADALDSDDAEPTQCCWQPARSGTTERLGLRRSPDEQRTARVPYRKQYSRRIEVVDNWCSRRFEFVRSNAFLGISGGILIINLVVIGLEVVYTQWDPVWFFCDQAFLIFYVFELFCRACHFQGSLLFDCSTSDVWYNYLDTTLVVFCVYDQWIDPLVAQGGSSISGVSSWIRALRVLRFLRALRLLRVLVEADTSWADGPEFQTFIACVILLNAALMGIETDVHWPGWFYLEHLILFVFVFELCVQLKHHGALTFLSCAQDGFLWNWLDFIIVWGGVVDQWVLPFVDLLDSEVDHGGSRKTNMVGKFMMLMRLMRLLRILRLLRLVKTVRPLYTLAQGVLAAMQGMFWVLVLTAMTLYAFAIVATKLIGHGMLFHMMEKETIESQAEHIEAVEQLFGTVTGSMFVLFLVMNGRADILEPLFVLIPWVKIIFVVFMVVTSWALLSILTAVLSENMIMETEKQDREAKEYEEQTQMDESKQRLETLFKALDKDDSDALDAHEFKKLLIEHGEELMRFSRLSKDEIHEVFDYLQLGGEVKLHDFVEGMLSLALSIENRRPVNERSMMKLERRLRELEADITSIKDVIRGNILEFEDSDYTKASTNRILQRSSSGWEDSDSDDECLSHSPSSFSAQPSAIGQPEAVRDAPATSVACAEPEPAEAQPSEVPPSDSRCSPCCGASQSKETVQTIQTD